MAFSQGKIQRHIEELAKVRYRAYQTIPSIVAQRLLLGEQESSHTSTVQRGELWGERDAIYDVRGRVSIPNDWQGKTLALHLDLAEPAEGWDISTIEGTLFIDGQAIHAIDRYHREVLLAPELTQRAELDFNVHLWTGITKDAHRLHCLELRLIDEYADALHHRLRECLSILKRLIPNDPAATTLEDALDAACLALDFRMPSSDTFYVSCKRALGILNERLVELTLPEGAHHPRAIAVGHAHIDVAWLWQLRHTRIKTANTFATALYHMDRHPHFIFMHSTPQVYQWVKEDDPDLYARIKAKVQAGQWEVEGGMWVEADTNITGGESLIRQFVHGMRFFREEFGYTCKVLWLPDVFGYSAALPQIIKGCGLDYFVTTKISWNDTNRFPYDTFWWEGLDGSRILAYFITAANDDNDRYYTYTANMSPTTLFLAWREYRQKAINDELLIAYGYGDGGGGPDREMVEAAGDLTALTSYVPSATPGRVADFMDRLAERIDGRSVPVWNGELYFEYHRGTYTSQARTKRNNRLAERDLHNAELLASMAQYLCGYQYPRAELDKAWKIALTHQFHDILPGSSIGPVYVDAASNYAAIRRITGAIIGDAEVALANAIDASSGSLLVFNTTSWTQGGLLELHANQAAKLGGTRQTSADDGVLMLVNDIPPFGYATISAGVTLTDAPLIVTERLLENHYLRVEFNDRGEITRLFDKAARGGAGREILCPGDRANVFQLFEDKPLNFDAWDIDAFYAQKQWELDGLPTVTVEETGPLRATIRVVWKYMDRTTIDQRIMLAAHGPQLDFRTEIDWHERQTLLKVAFPVDIHSARATAEIQFGVVERPTHTNTSWDEARFETSAHKWVDLSEGDYGVALLNDCKYGYDIHGRILRQTLLKAGIVPDPKADEGHHSFTYSLLPHAGDWFTAGVPRAAYALNYPLSTVPVIGKGTIIPRQSFVTVDAPGVVIETVKQAEASDALVIRIYETANRHSLFTLHLPFVASHADETNLMEEEPRPVSLAADGRSIQGEIGPFQIKTFVVQKK
jgi:alpha-mannosidase